MLFRSGRWKAATKGAFDSAQALWAQRRLDKMELATLVPGVTYLAEAVYPENRIVIRYEEAALVILAAYDEHGIELANTHVEAIAGKLGWRTAKRYSFNSVSDLVAHAQSLPRTEEGFVLRFENGLRLKVKGSEYRRIHALISRVTPLAMWEAMVAGDDLDGMRRDLPEEFWNDFDAIRKLLTSSYENLIGRAKAAADEVKHLSDKEVGLQLSKLPPDVRSYIFPLRKSVDGERGLDRIRQFAFRDIRPTSNVLPGYVASYAVTRVNEESS